MSQQLDGTHQSSLHYRKRLEQVLADAQSIVGTAQLIGNRIAVTLDHGGQLQPIASQMNFLVGALARMQKDFGVIEHLQLIGVTAKRPLRANGAHANGTAQTSNR